MNSSIGLRVSVVFLALFVSASLLSAQTTPTAPEGVDADARAADRAKKVKQLKKSADDAFKARGKAKSGAEASEQRRIEAKSRVLAALVGDEALDADTKALAQEARLDTKLSTAHRFEVARLQELALHRGPKLGSKGEWLRDRESTAQQLVTEFPTEPAAFSNLYAVALQTTPDRALPLARQVLDSPADANTKSGARSLITRLTIEKRHFSDAVEGVPGFSVLLGKHRGEWIVFYTWRPDDEDSVRRAQEIAALAPVKATVYGINLDRAIPGALKAAEKKRLPGSQLGNGRGFDHPIAVRLGLTESGVVYAVSRDGLIHNLTDAADLGAAFSKLN